MSEDLAIKMMELFPGNKRGHGSFTETGIKENGKHEGKARTLLEMYTEKKWCDHLNGITRIGIIPINDQQKTKWFAIDVDTYPCDLLQIEKKIKSLDLPLHPARSKSGGAHIYCFLTEEVEATFAKAKASEWSSLLGFGQCEIFPKQGMLAVERGDLGNWINMPYFNIKDCNTYFIEDGKPLTCEEFLNKVDGWKITPDQLTNHAPSLKKVFKVHDGAPPCVFSIFSQKVVKFRNEILQHCVVLAKKIDPDNWQKIVEYYNTGFEEPLSSKELQETVFKSNSKKDYEYLCKKAPMCDHCNVAVCRTRKYGIGGGDNVGIINIRCLNTDPRTWVAETTNSFIIECTSDILYTQRDFAILCLEKTKQAPVSMKQADWVNYINGFTKNCLEVDIAIEATREGKILEMLEKFCTGRVQADTFDMVLTGKPFTNHEIKRTYFLLSALEDYIKRTGFKSTQREITVFLHEHLKAKKELVDFKGKKGNVWSIEAFGFQTEPFDRKPKKEKPDAY